MQATIARPTCRTQRPRIIVADDEESMRYFVGRTLARLGYDPVAVADGDQAIAEFDRRRADAVVVDLRMPGADGLAVLAALRRRDPDVAVVMMTAFGTVPTAVRAMQGGAHDFLGKPFEAEHLAAAVERALQQRALQRIRRGAAPTGHRASLAALVGHSPAMRAVIAAIDLLAGSDATVLLTGEAGTGKELVARAIHCRSARGADGAFVPLHCAALCANLIDSELFGHAAGAFTGARTAKAGLLRRADRGTLFLDDIAEIDAAAQYRLERFLEDREVVPVGATAGAKLDVRVIAATHRDPLQEVAAGRLREGLYYRLNVVPVHLPPLRERREDIPALVGQCLRRLTPPGMAVKPVSEAAMAALVGHDWPGNLRQLENTVERLLVLSRGRDVIAAADLGGEPAAGSGDAAAAADAPVDYHQAIATAERRYLETLMRDTGGNVSEAARRARLSRGHLHRKMGRLGVDPARFRDER